MAKFHFDEAEHKYTLDGEEIPGVTGILKAVGLIDDRWWKENAWVNGKELHHACHLMDEDDLDYDTLKPMHYGYLEAYARFKEDHEFLPGYIEQPAYHQFYRYAGTPDRLKCCIDGLQGILDIKTGQPQKWHTIQLCAYLAIAESWRRIAAGAKLWDLYLQKNAKYKLIEHKMDEEIWPACLRVYQWR